MSNLQTTKPGPKPVPRGQCVVDGCIRQFDHPVSGLCAAHYRQRRDTGLTKALRRDRGTGTITQAGYVAHTSSGKKKMEHIIVAERALGKSMPPGAEVHHWNEDKADNRPCNLVICPDKAYHKLLHTRMAALEACGQASHRKCPFCKQYSPPESMSHNKSSRYFYHPACKTEYRKSRSNT